MSSHAAFVVAWKVLTALATLSKCHCLASFLGPVENICLVDTASAHSLCAEDLTATLVLTERGRFLLCLLFWLQQNLFSINKVCVVCIL